MSSKADRLALKVILKLMAVVAVLLGVRYLAQKAPSWVAEMKVEQAKEQANKQVLLVTSGQANLPVNYHPPQVVSAMRPAQTPTAQALPRRFSLRVLPKQWSKRIDLPAGRTALVTFSLGRIRVERNGVDEGICFRQPVVTGGQGGGLSLHPFTALVDRTPRTIAFGPDTRTLRFMSGESESGDILVELK